MALLPMTAPLLDGCTLAVLAQGDTYGYALNQRLCGTLEVSESTLYPVLRRLQKEGCLRVYDQQFQGRNRRYYAITPAGQDRLAQCRLDWAEFEERVSRILMGGNEDG